MADPARGTADREPGKPDPAIRILSYCEAVIEAEHERGFAAGYAAGYAAGAAVRRRLRVIGRPPGDREEPQAEG